MALALRSRRVTHQDGPLQGFFMEIKVGRLMSKSFCYAIGFVPQIFFPCSLKSLPLDNGLFV